MGCRARSQLAFKPPGGSDSCPCPPPATGAAANLLCHSFKPFFALNDELHLFFGCMPSFVSSSVACQRIIIAPNELARRVPP